MPRRNLLTSAERIALLAFPLPEDEMIRHYTFSEADLAVIRQHRGGQNRLGFAVQLCVLRYPGCALSPDAQAPEALLAFVAHQLRVEPDLWSQYAQRAETRREHLLELQAWLALTPLFKDSRSGQVSTSVHDIAAVSFGVPDIRMMKVRQKVVGGFCRLSGVQMFCRLRSYISTLRKQGLPVLPALEQLFQGRPLYPALDA